MVNFAATTRRWYGQGKPERCRRMPRLPRAHEGAQSKYDRHGPPRRKRGGLFMPKRRRPRPHRRGFCLAAGRRGERRMYVRGSFAQCRRGDDGGRAPCGGKTRARRWKRRGAELETLRAEVERFRAGEQARMAADEEARRRAEVERRFEAAAGDREFLHEYVRKGLLADFAAALEGRGQRRKRAMRRCFPPSRGRKNCFAAQNPPPPLPAPEAAELERASGGEAFRALPLYEQFPLCPARAGARPPLSGGMSAPRFADIRAPCPAAPVRDPF